MPAGLQPSEQTISPCVRAAGVRTGPALADAGVVRGLAGEDLFRDAALDAEVRDGLDEGGEVLERPVLVVIRQFDQAAIVQGVEDAFHGGGAGG